VPHRRDDRDRGPSDRPGDDLLVEAPEILDGSPTARDDDDVAAGTPAELSETARDLERRVLALNARRADDQVKVPVPAAEDLEDVADRGAVQ
jgi:hypothetical protein